MKMITNIRNYGFFTNNLGKKYNGATIPAFSTITAYPINQIVYDGDLYAYQHITASGASSSPPSTDTVNWTRLGPTNYIAMFDSSSVTASYASYATSGAMDVEIYKNLPTNTSAGLVFGLNEPFDSILLINVKIGSTWTFEHASTDAAGSSRVSFFSTTVTVTQPNMLIPFTFNPEISSGSARYNKLRITGNGYIGTFMFGMKYELGDTKKGYDVSINDYSLKSVDIYGNLTLTKRGYAMRLNVKTFIGPSNVVADSIGFILAGNRATIVGWIGDENRYLTTFAGFWKDWSILKDEQENNILSISVDGVV